MVLFSLMISMFIRKAKITIENEMIVGLNYWGIRKSIPLADIISTSPFSSNGINAIVVYSRSSGKIYISDQTIGFEDLLKLLELYISNNGHNQGMDPTR